VIAVKTFGDRGGDDGDEAEDAEDEKQELDHQQNHNHNYPKQKHVQNGSPKKRSFGEMNGEGGDLVKNLFFDSPMKKKRKVSIACNGKDEIAMVAKEEQAVMGTKMITIICDPLQLMRMKNDAYSVLWDINDCRKDIWMDQATEEDEAKRNVVAVQCKVNGWPRTFIVVDKAIKAGHELLSFCGIGYEDNIYAQQRDSAIRAMLNSLSKQ